MGLDGLLNDMCECVNFEVEVIGSLDKGGWGLWFKMSVKGFVEGFKVNVT